MSSSPTYEELTKTLQTIANLARVSSIVNYDQMVFMPKTDQASAERGKQLAALASVIHEKSTDTKLGELLDQAEAELLSGNDDITQQRVVELARKGYTKQTCISTELAARKASLRAAANHAWTKARAADDYSMFQDLLQQCIDVSKEIALAEQHATSAKDCGTTPKALYATMLDEYETGMDPDRIDAIFQEIQEALVPLIDRVLGSDAAAPSQDARHGEFQIPAQEALSKEMVRAIGFDDSRGRIDVSVHPFTSSSSPHDVRITSRFSNSEWVKGLAGSMHEAGHAMYEAHLGDSGLPIDSALSMGMHESQSLFWERHVGLSKPFWTYAAPSVNKHLSLSFTPEEYYGAVNVANRSFIRVEADELTYPLHIVLRYNLERDMMKTDVTALAALDIPNRWNTGMKELLKVDVPSDAKGCLQDIHWSMLAFGYFPTYLLGAATAAQLAHYCQQDIPDFDDKVATGEFAPLKAWMKDKVHQHGSRYKSLDEHLEAQLGEKLNPKYFIEYLTKKYADLYTC